MTRSRRRSTQNQQKSNETLTGKNSGEVNDEHEALAMETLQASIGAIHKEIQAIRVDVKEELGRFSDNLTRDTKKDMASFREDVNEKLNEIVKDLKETRDRGNTASCRHGGMDCRGK